MDKVFIDVRGLACPEPLIAFTDAAKKAEINEIEISFDCGAARENIVRSAASLGWAVLSVTEAADHTVLCLKKTV